jgi:hypothetical protein
MTREEEEIVEAMSRSAADRAEVLTRGVTQNTKYLPFTMIAAVMQDVAFHAWGVASGDEEPEALLRAAEEGLAALDTQAQCTVERVMLRQVIADMRAECAAALVPADACVTGPECMAAHLADLETESEI